MPKKLSFCFFASSPFGLWALKTVVKAYKPALIVTLPAKPAGRGLKLQQSEVSLFAQKEKIPCLEIGSHAEFQKLEGLSFNFGLIAGYGKIIPESVFPLFKKGLLNLHPSLLPKFRGANPIRETILAGEQETGATFFIIDALVDHGPLLAQEKIHLNEKETAADLEMKLGQCAGNLFNKNIEAYLSGDIVPHAQDEKEVTLTKKVEKLDGLLSIDGPYELWDRKIRALAGWPGTFIKMNIKGSEKLVKIFSIEKLRTTDIDPKNRNTTVGTFFQHRKELALQLTDAALVIHDIQLQDKKRMNSKEFLNGYCIADLKIVHF